MDREPVTSLGAKKLQDDLKKCMELRPQIIEAISTARDFGDISENAEYHAAREQQSHVEGRILELNGRLAIIEIIDLDTIVPDRVKFGTTVKVVDLDTDEEITYTIASDLESNPSEGWISYKCPLGKSLIGKKVDDIADFEHAGSYKEFEVISISKVE